MAALPPAVRLAAPTLAVATVGTATAVLVNRATGPGATWPAWLGVVVATLLSALTSYWLHSRQTDHERSDGNNSARFGRHTVVERADQRARNSNRWRSGRGSYIGELVMRAGPHADNSSSPEPTRRSDRTTQEPPSPL
jgi:hypothetical protein